MSNEFKSGFDHGVELALDCLDDYLIRYKADTVGDVLSALRTEIEHEAENESELTFMFNQPSNNGLIAALLNAVGYEAAKASRP